MRSSPPVTVVSFARCSDKYGALVCEKESLLSVAAILVVVSLATSETDISFVVSLATSEADMSVVVSLATSEVDIATSLAASETTTGITTSLTSSEAAVSVATSGAAVVDSLQDIPPPAAVHKVLYFPPSKHLTGL